MNSRPAIGANGLAVPHGETAHHLLAGTANPASTFFAGRVKGAESAVPVTNTGENDTGQVRVSIEEIRLC